MSEYQYYEFQKIGASLSDEAMREVSKLSSRAKVTRTSASFTYNFGDFRAKPLEVLERHFEAFLYFANWGTRQLAFRLPTSAVKYSAIRLFELGQAIRIVRKEEFLVVNMTLQDEDLGQWLDANGALDHFAGFYHEFLAGDFRALFLVWLKAASFEIQGNEEDEEDGDIPLPPIPPGLLELSDAHHTLIDFFDIDSDVVTAAGPFSMPIRRVSTEDTLRRLDSIPDSEKTAFLKRMLLGESPSIVIVELQKRLQSETPSGQAGTASSPRSPGSARVLFEKARQLQEDRKNKTKKQEDAKRLQRLGEIERDQQTLWRRVDELIAAKTTKAYDEAIAVLKDLRDLALHRQRQEEFAQRITEIREMHSRLGGLQARIKEAELL